MLEYKGPGVYKITGERIAPLDGLDFKRQGEIFDHGPRHWVESKKDFDHIWGVEYTYGYDLTRETYIERMERAKGEEEDEEQREKSEKRKEEV